jgi:hypothetical protein
MTTEVPEPFDEGRIDVGDGHVLFYEQVGIPDGTPIVYLHGGPGSGCTPGLVATSTSDVCAVLFDQRAAAAAPSPPTRTSTGHRSTWTITPRHRTTPGAPRHRSLDRVRPLVGLCVGSDLPTPSRAGRRRCRRRGQYGRADIVGSRLTLDGSSRRVGCVP